jgi:hypothetical protein
LGGAGWNLWISQAQSDVRVWFREVTQNFKTHGILQQLGIRVRFASSKMRSASLEPQPEIADFPFDVQTSSTHIKISPTV